MKYDVVTIGSATRDVYLLGLRYDKHKDKHFKTGVGVCMPLGSKVDVPRIYYTTGGAGTNAAVTFARQGLKTAAIVHVGEDSRARELLLELKNEEIDTSLVQIDESMSTGQSIVLLTPGGERTILAHRGASEGLDARKIPWSKIMSQWVYLNSLYENTGLLKGAIMMKKRHGTKIAWNPGGSDLKMGLKKLKKYLKYVDVFIANQEEVSLLFGLPYRATGRIFKKIDEDIGGITVMTRGPDGVIVSDGRTLYRGGIYKEKKMVDRTGAGDSFGSGFVAGLIKKGSIEYAIRFASANATSKVEDIGAKKGLLRKGEFERSKRWAKFKLLQDKLS